MAEILGAVTSGTKFFLEVNAVSIDNLTFKLYYKATTTILLALSIICTSKQFFGDPISCDVRGGGVNDKVLNTYCWMYAKFDIRKDFMGQCYKREVDGSNLYNTYYQWVAIYLVVQAVIFYIPRMLWLSCEGGLLKFLAKGTRGKIVEDAQEKIENLLATFQEHLHNKYNRYAFLFFLCELLNLVVVISQIFVTNRFLNYMFLDYGLKVWEYFGVPEEERLLFKLNPMCEVFPRLASCTYNRYGGGGDEESKNALCVLGLNMINDKVFLIIWVWYFFLMFNSLFRFIYRICQLLFPRLRFWMIRRKIARYFKSSPNTRHMEHYIMNAKIGDWFVLYQMAKNINKRFFSEFLTILSKRVNPHPDEECDEAPFFHKCPVPGSKECKEALTKRKVDKVGLMDQMKLEVTKEANGGATAPEPEDNIQKSRSRHPKLSDCKTKSPDWNSKIPDSTLKTPDFKPKTPDFKPKTPDFKPKTPDFKPKTPDFKPKTPDFKPKTPDFKSKTPDFKCETPDCKSKTPECTGRSVGQSLDLTYMGEDPEDKEEKKGNKEKMIPGKGDMVSLID